MIYASVQFVVIFALVGLSVIMLARKLFPAAMAAWQARGAAVLNRSPIAFVRSMGRRLEPAAKTASGSCGSGCDSCKACSAFKPSGGNV